MADTQFQKKAVTQTVPEHYYGYRMPWPLTEAALHGLLRAVKTKPSVPLHEKYVANILVAAKQMFQNLSRVTDIQVLDPTGKGIAAPVRATGGPGRSAGARLPDWTVDLWH